MKEPHCKSLSRKMSDYIDGSLDSETLAKIKSHLKNCRPCVAFFKTLQKTVGALGALKSAATLSRKARGGLREKLKSLSRSD